MGVDVDAHEDTIGVQGEWEIRLMLGDLLMNLELTHLLYGQRILLFKRLKVHLLGPK